MEKYHCTKDNILETLDKYGIAIVNNVLSEKEIKNMQDGMFLYIEYLTQDFEVPFNRYKPETYVEFFKLLPNKDMLMQFWQVGHAQFIWDIRQNPKVVELFASIWNCKLEELITSFDGAAFHFPPEITKRGNFDSYWYHTDQSFMRPDFECVQSWITAFDVNEGDATLTFIEGSHKYSKEISDKYYIYDESDWNPLYDDELLFYIEDKKLEEKEITCSAGAMVFWDSRTVHCGIQSDENRIKENFRCAAYICMTPRYLADEEILKKRIEAFEALQMTNHWAHKPRILNKYPTAIMQNKIKMPPVKLFSEKPILTELGLKLVGY